MGMLMRRNYSTDDNKVKEQPKVAPTPVIKEEEKVVEKTPFKEKLTKKK